MQKTQQRTAKLHAQITDIRADALHQLTTDLVRRFDVIAIEDLNMAGMLKNHPLARAIASRSGVTVVVVNRCRKTRSACGYQNPKIPLSARTCRQCQTHHDRDLNAAMNLQKVAVGSVRRSSPVSVQRDCPLTGLGSVLPWTIGP